MTLKLNNRFENNIIADVIAPRGTYLKIVEGPMKGASNKRNIFYSSLADCTFISEPGAGTGRVGEDRRGRVAARMKDIESDHNIYYCKADRSLGEETLEKTASAMASTPTAWPSIRCSSIRKMATSGSSRAHRL